MEKKELSEQHKRFCREYVVNYSRKNAAIAAGYSEKNAYNQGGALLKKPEIQEYIDELNNELSLSAGAIIKKQTDIALSNLSDYMKPDRIERKRRVKIPLKKDIDELKRDIHVKQRYIQRAELTEKETKNELSSIRDMQNRLVILEIKLEDDPKSYRIGWESKLETTMKLDLVSLAKDKERGIIKHLEWGEFGPKITMPDSGTALDRLAKIRDLYIEKSETKIAMTNVDKEDINNVFEVKIIPPEEE